MDDIQKVLIGLFLLGLEHRHVLASIHDHRYQQLRRQLVQLRKTAQLTQVQLAELLGIGQSYVSKIERGEVYVEVWLFVDWCRKCGAQPDSAMSELIGASSTRTAKVKSHLGN